MTLMYTELVSTNWSSSDIDMEPRCLTTHFPGLMRPPNVPLPLDNFSPVRFRHHVFRPIRL